ncbi:MAG: ADOP family duplicated permease, partial [Longimicrobiales bacterium]
MVRVMVAAPYREDALGDVCEEYATAIRPRYGRLRSLLWLWAQIARAAVASRWHGRGLGNGQGVRGGNTQRGATVMLTGLRQDLRYALRTFARAPFFTGVALITLSVGMGATIAMYTVVNGVLVRPLPYASPEELVFVQGGEAGRWAITYPDYVDLREQGRAFESLAVWQGWTVIMNDQDGAPTRQSAASVSWSFFGMLGVQPAVGRFFVAEEGVPNHAPVVVLSHAVWQESFGGREDVLGATFDAGEGERYTIVGVAPEGFIDPVGYATWGSRPVVWRSDPPPFSLEQADRGWIGFWTLGRLRDESSIAQAQSDVYAVIRAAYPAADGTPQVRVASLLDAMVGDVRRTLLVMLGAVAMVLLIGCANVANLLLSRASVRGREVTVRAALGAGRQRLVAQLLTESLVLSLAAAVIGLGIAAAGARAVVALSDVSLPRAWEVLVDWRVVLFAVGISLMTALFFGLAPALHLTTDRIAGGIREGGRGGAMGGRGRRLRNVLVVGETALAVVLLVGAGLLLRTMWNLQRIDPGFEPRGTLVVNVGLPPVTFTTPAEQSHVLERMIEEAAALPGVSSAGAITDLPMSGAINSTNVLREDVPPPPPSERRHALVRAISPSYFTTMGIPIVRGRAVEPIDREGTPDVVVVNERFVEMWFPGEEAIGRTVNVRGVSAQIVGIVANVKEFTLEDGPDPVLYTAYSQEKQPWMRERMTLVVKTEATDPASLTPAVRSALRRAHALIPVNRVRTLEDVVSAHVAEPRFRATVVLL